MVLQNKTIHKIHKEEPFDSKTSSHEYSLEDEEYSQYDVEDNDEDENDDDDREHPSKSRTPLKMLFTMMINPIEGWKNIRRSKITPEAMARGCFYPLVALASISCFLDCLYNSATTLSMAVVEGVKIFTAFFFGYFVSLQWIKLWMLADMKQLAESSYGRQYVMYLLSTLAIFWVIYSTLPMFGPVISFLPLWTIYLAMRGARFFRFPEEKKSLLTTLVCLSVIGAPLFMYWVFDILLPNNI